ncbi:hypothetical protein MKW94_000577 [Papaver nudicaule]|uniref:Uncharacterized protein n=1 Tax=Papaver nudicaule TaxID=74823 RepID=A0AA41VVY6_PAPNU|nr:hypothetical protein [Papaver nudicaule]
MSWYTDPQLFIFSYDAVYFYVYRVTKKFGINPVLPSDYSYQEDLTFSKHLNLGNNRESDYDAFKAAFPKSGIRNYINRQGWVVNWDLGISRGTWSREEPNSPFWSLPGITKQKSATGEALEEKVSVLEAKPEDEINNNKKEKADSDKRVLDLESEISRERDEKSALKQQVLDLTSKLSVQCSDAAGSGGSSIDEEPWITGQTVPSNWVPFDDLDVQSFSKNVPLMITKATGGLKFGDDNTTNVQASRFYGGIFPIAVVDIGELTPNREEARFNPDVWSRYYNAGITYAARKLFPSEISIDAHKTC